VADQPKILCIVARDRLRGRDFIAALGASLGPDDQLEIIVDRRSGEPSDDWDRAQDRRRRPQVDLALRANGFAVVPAPRPREERSMREERIPRDARAPRGERSPLSLLVPSPPTSRLAPAARDDAEAYAGDDDEERLEAILSFKRGRARVSVPWLIAALAVVVAAASVLSPTVRTIKQSLAHRASPEAPGRSSQPPAQTPDASPTPRGVATAERPATAERHGVSEKPAVAEAPSRAPANEVALAERSTLGPISSASERSSLPSRDAATDASPRDTRTPLDESRAAPRVAIEEATAGRPRPMEVPRPSVNEPAPRRAAAVPAPAEPRARLVSPRFAGLPRVELSREPGTPNGTYTVRIVDPGGKPLGDAEVLLLARMPDGTVENIRMDFYPDHGTYRGALPPTRSSPVDLRVRVITGDKRVEIPLGP